MMNEKQKMTSSYKAVFVFSIVMSVLMFVLYSAEYQTTHKASSTAIPFLLWCYQTWLIYKQQNAKLVGFYKAMLWIGGIALALLSLMLIGNVDVYGVNVPKLIGIAVMLGIYYGMLQFFKQQLVNPSVTSKTSNNSNASNDDYLRAEVEFNSAQRDAGLWARCFAEADGNEATAKARYIKSRASKVNTNPPSNNKFFEDSKSIVISTFKKLAILNIAGLVLLIVYVVYKAIFALPSTNIVNKITDIVSKKEVVYDVYSCIDYMNTTKDECAREVTKTAKFSIDKNTSQVIISYTPTKDPSKINIIKLDKCIVIDSKNWKCGGDFTTESYGSGISSIHFDPTYKSNEGVITTVDGSNTIHFPNDRKTTTIFKPPQFIIKP